MGFFNKRPAAKVMWPESEKGEQLMYKFPGPVSAGASLIVRANEFAVLYQYGAVKKVYTEPGQSILPVDGEVYFVSKSRFEGRFGTKQALTFHDARFDMVQLKAFGEYKAQVTDPVKFIHEIGGERGSVSPNDIAETVRDEVVMALNQALGRMKKKGMAVTHIPQKLRKIGMLTVKVGKSSFSNMGLTLNEISELYINPPKKVKDAIEEVSSISAYTDDQIKKRARLAAADAMRDAAKSGGSVSIGRIGDESNVTIKDSVVQRSNIGGGGGGGGGGSGETNIQDSVLTRTNVGGGGGGGGGGGAEVSCPNCGGAVRKGWVACPACGEKIKKGCPKCGADIQPGWVACPACGSHL